MCLNRLEDKLVVDCSRSKQVIYSDLLSNDEFVDKPVAGANTLAIRHNHPNKKEPIINAHSGTYSGAYYPPLPQRPHQRGSQQADRSGIDEHHASEHLVSKGSANVRYQQPMVDRCYLPEEIEMPHFRGYRSRLSDPIEIPVRQHTRNSPRPKRVMIVDDNEDNLMLACYIVEEEGYLVTAVASGHKAVETAIACQPDIILLDIALGSVSGIDVFYQIKRYEQFANMPIVAITALAQASIKREAIAVGFADYLLKPYRIETLCELVKKHIQKKPVVAGELSSSRLYRSFSSYADSPKRKYMI